MVYTSYEKALNHVDHGVLLRNVHEYGVRDILLNLPETHLTNQHNVSESTVTIQKTST